MYITIIIKNVVLNKNYWGKKALKNLKFSAKNTCHLKRAALILWPLFVSYVSIKLSSKIYYWPKIEHSELNFYLTHYLASVQTQTLGYQSCEKDR